ncbi:restriction endonuclease subunit S [Kocuria palustris]|uniref:restriction endonuclease subunit S n=1 Tax=Kocuria palustris TaxID=71999 RepID=UPI0035D90B12
MLERPLSSICVHRPGKYLPKAEYSKGGPYRVHGSNSIMGTHTSYLYPGPMTVLARIGSKCGALAWEPNPAWINNNASVLCAREGTDSRWLHMLLSTLNMDEFREGSGQPFIAVKALMNAPVVVPSLVEQQRIAGVLGAFDDLIERNLRLVRTMETLGDTLLSLASAGGDVQRLDQSCDIIESGKRPKGGVRGIASGVPSIGAEFINGLTPFAFEKTKFVPSDFAAAMRRGVLEDMDVLVYKDGGKPGEFFPDVSAVGRGYPFGHMVINEHVFRVRAREAIGQGYLYFWLHSPAMMQAMKEIGSRTAAIPGMNASNFGALPIRVPTPEAKAICTQLDLYLGACLELLAECRDLAAQRDELLPLLMSGKVRVSEVEGSLP